MIAFRCRRFVVVVFFLSLPFLFDKAGYESFCFMHPMIHIFQTKKEPSSGTANCFQCRHHMGLPNGVCNSTRNHLFLAFNTTSYVASSQGLRAGDVVSITVTRALGGQYGLLPFSTSCPSSHRLQLWKLLIFLTVSSTLLLLPTKPFSLDLEQHFSYVLFVLLGEVLRSSFHVIRIESSKNSSWLSLSLSLSLVKTEPSVSNKYLLYSLRVGLYTIIYVWSVHRPARPVIN